MTQLNQYTYEEKKDTRKEGLDTHKEGISTQKLINKLFHVASEIEFPVRMFFKV